MSSYVSLAIAVTFHATLALLGALIFGLQVHEVMAGMALVYSLINNKNTLTLTEALTNAANSRRD